LRVFAWTAHGIQSSSIQVYPDDVSRVSAHRGTRLSQDFNNNFKPPASTIDCTGNGNPNISMLLIESVRFVNQQMKDTRILSILFFGHRVYSIGRSYTLQYFLVTHT